MLITWTVRGYEFYIQFIAVKSPAICNGVCTSWSNQKCQKLFAISFLHSQNLLVLTRLNILATTYVLVDSFKVSVESTLDSVADNEFKSFFHILCTINNTVCSVRSNFGMPSVQHFRDLRMVPLVEFVLSWFM